MNGQQRVYVAASWHPIRQRFETLFVEGRALRNEGLIPAITARATLKWQLLASETTAPSSH